MNESRVNEVESNEKLNSIVQQMINDIENRQITNKIENKHVRLLNNDTEFKVSRVPVSRVPSRDRINSIKKMLFKGHMESNLSSSQPSLVKPKAINNRNSPRLKFEQKCTKSTSPTLNETPEVCLQSSIHIFHVVEILGIYI